MLLSFSGKASVARALSLQLCLISLLMACMNNRGRGAAEILISSIVNREMLQPPPLWGVSVHIECSLNIVICLLRLFTPRGRQCHLFKVLLAHVARTLITLMPYLCVGAL